MNNEIKTYEDLQKRIKELEHDLSIRDQIDKTLLFLSQYGWEDPRESFFHSLARFLAETLEMDYVCIDKLHGNLLEAETFAIYYDGKFEDNVSYTLNETPCGEVVGKHICCFSEGVRHLFKNDIVLQDMIAESYIGTTLWNSKNEPIGLIAVIGRKPLANTYFAETILKLAAVRASGELERIKAEQTLMENEQIQIKINADKDRFISILAHDLKSPFNTLLGFSELLSKNIKKYSVEKIESQINIVYEIAKRTSNLLDDILIWARLQTGRLTFSPQKQGFSDICEQVIDNLEMTASFKNISINYFAPAGITIHADKNMLNTILRNLVSNAIKFTNRNGQIDIYAELDEKEATITVSDDGVGISPNIIKQLFDHSQKITTEGTANEKGTGLGLILCREFVEIHKGRIWVESELGKGSEFKFTIPLYKEAIACPS